MTLIDDVRKLREDVTTTDGLAEANAKEIATLKEQINGERGLSAAINNQTREIASLRKAAYWVAGLIIAGSIGFGFSVLLLINQGP